MLGGVHDDEKKEDIVEIEEEEEIKREILTKTMIINKKYGW